MSIAHRLASAVLLMTGILIGGGCGGGGAAAPGSQSILDDDPDAVILDGREGIPRLGAPFGSEAHVEVVRRSGQKSGDKFRVDAFGLPIGTKMDIWLEDPSLPATLTIVGSFEIGFGLTGELLLSTWDGDTLPYDVPNVMKLVGRAIQLRTPAGMVLFAGTVPPID